MAIKNGPLLQKQIRQAAKLKRESDATEEFDFQLGRSRWREKLDKPGPITVIFDNDTGKFPGNVPLQLERTVALLAIHRRVALPSHEEPAAILVNVEPDDLGLWPVTLEEQAALPERINSHRAA